MKKGQIVRIRLPEELVRDLETIQEIEHADRPTTVRKLLYKAIKDWKLEYYAQLYGKSEVTLARAAKEAGVSLWKMIDYASDRKVAAQYDLEDFRRDFRKMQAR